MTRKVIITVFVVATTLWIGVMGFDRALKARFVGPEHVDRLAVQPAFLTEDLAITTARQAMTRDGFDTNVWALVPDNRSSSPDGTADSFFVRRPTNPNAGRFTVRDPNGAERFVHVKLEGDRISACVVRPK